MDTGPLVAPPPVKAGMEALAFLKDAGFALDAAFWYLERESSEWRLCVSAPEFAGGGVSAGYKALVSRKRESVPADQIQVSDRSDVFVKEALEYAKMRGRNATLAGDVAFGPYEVSAVYFYGPMAPSRRAKSPPKGGVSYTRKSASGMKRFAAKAAPASKAAKSAAGKAANPKKVPHTP